MEDISINHYLHALSVVSSCERRFLQPPQLLHVIITSRHNNGIVEPVKPYWTVSFMHFMLHLGNVQSFHGITWNLSGIKGYMISMKETWFHRNIYISSIRIQCCYSYRKHFHTQNVFYWTETFSQRYMGWEYYTVAF